MACRIAGAPVATGGDRLPPVDAAFLDPGWAVTGPDHVHHFMRSSTNPPADELLERAFRAAPNLALVLPPKLDVREFDALPGHERQKLYMDQSHELYCLYFVKIVWTAPDAAALTEFAQLQDGPPVGKSRARKVGWPESATLALGTLGGFHPAVRERSTCQHSPLY